MSKLIWKIYDHSGVMQATTKDLRAAKALVDFYGNNATIRTVQAGTSTHLRVWTYDQVPHASFSRVEAHVRTKIGAAWERFKKENY
jgi:hypothetical protein